MNADSTKRRNWKRIVVAQIAVCAVGLVLAEVGFRTYLRFSGKPYDSAETRDAIQLLRSRASELTPQVRSPIAAHPVNDERQKPILHPYLGYIAQSKPGQWEVEMSRVGVPEFDDDYEILVVGGSVADIFGHAGVVRMVEHLRADPLFANRRIYVYSYGLGGFKQPQLTNLVGFMLILGFTPECVINIDGFNEVALTRENAFLGTNPLFPSSMHWGSLTVGAAPDREAMLLAAHGIELQASVVAAADRALEWGFPHSAIAGTLALKHMRSSTRQALEDFKAYAQRITMRSSDLVRHGLPFPEDPTAVVAMGVKAWEEGSRTLRGMCEVRKMHYLHVLQPTLHDEGSKQLTKREIENGIAPPTWIEGVHIGYPLLREAGQRLKADGEDFVDATQLFADVKGKIYFDNCHFGEEGNWMLGDFVARALLDSVRASK